MIWKANYGLHLNIQYFLKGLPHLCEIANYLSQMELDISLIATPSLPCLKLEE